VDDDDDGFHAKFRANCDRPKESEASAGRGSIHAFRPYSNPIWLRARKMQRGMFVRSVTATDRHRRCRGNRRLSDWRRR
jgi:hypothetical protein